MDLGIKGKGIIVTGAGQGIGRAIALAFADEGANAAICAHLLAGTGESSRTESAGAS